MAARVIQVLPFDLVVFGGTGDLAYRKLYPALLRRDLDGQISEPTRILGVSRRAMSDSAFCTSVHDNLVKFTSAIAPAVMERF